MKEIKSLVRRGRYRLSLHAEQERDADAITVAEIEQVLLSARLEIIEDYADDPRGHSRLLLGFTRTKKPVHVVCAIHETTLVIITVYRPDPRLWQKYRVRRKEKA